MRIVEAFGGCEENRVSNDDQVSKRTNGLRKFEMVP